MYAGSSNLKCMEEEFRCMMMLMLLIIAVLLDIARDYYLYTVWITIFPHKNQDHLVIRDSNGTHYTELVSNRNFFFHHGNT